MLPGARRHWQLLYLGLGLGLVLACWFWFRSPSEELPQTAPPQKMLRFQPAWLLTLLPTPTGQFPADLPWRGLLQLTTPNPDESDPLPHPDPLVFLEQCLQRYQQQVRGYRVTLQKRERVGGRLYPPEIIRVWFREHPFSVLMKWQAGARRAQAALYVAGENQNHVLIRPAGLWAVVGVVERPLDDPEVQASGRYGIHQFGLRQATERVLAGWRAARARQALHVTYEGVYRLPEAGDRLCYRLHRHSYEQPEDGGVADLLVYIDLETGLQVGTVLRDATGQLLGEYYFRDLYLNPDFPPDCFSRQALLR